MRFTIVALRDIKANYWHPPIFVRNTMVTLRNLSDEINTPEKKEDWQRHPEDFELYELGSWDSEQGDFDIANPKQICVLSSLRS